MSRRSEPELVRLFSEAVELEPGAREAFIRQQPIDESTANELRSLLEAGEAPSLLDRPALGAHFRVPDPSELIHPEAAPTTIGNYRILRKLGAGVSSIVYVAEQTSPVRRKVALKLLRAVHLDSETQRRFLAEPHTLARVDHPNVVPILDSGVGSEGAPYFTMRLVEGAHLTTFCQAQPVNERLRLFADVCDAVHAAHLAGVHHRDLKPSNVLVEQRHGRPSVAIIDFGVARVDAPWLQDAAAETRPGVLVGSLGYMAPEQLDRTWGAPDARVDMYALGCLLHELVTNDPAHPPVDGESLQHLIERRTARPVTLPRQYDRRLRAIVERATAPRPSQRYPSVAELADDVRRYLDGRPVAARPFSSRETLRLHIQRRPLRYGAGLLGVIVVGVLVGWIQVQQDQAQLKSAAMRETARVLTQTVLPRLERTLGAREDRAEIYAALRTPLEEYAARFPDDVEIQLSRALVIAAEAGDALDARDIAAARAGFESARDILADFQPDAPNSETVRRFIEMIIRLGDCAKAESEWDTARTLYDDAHSRILDLERQFPKQAEILSDRVHSHRRIAEMAGLQGLVADQDEHRRLALTVAKSHLVNHPNKQLARADYVVASMDRITWLRSYGRFEELPTMCEEVVAHCRDLVADEPTARVHQRTLGVALTMLGDAYKRNGYLERAHSAITDAHQVFEHVFARDPEHPETRFGLVRVLSVLASLELNVENHDATVEFTQRALSLLDGLQMSPEESLRWCDELHWLRCRAHWSRGAQMDAQAAFDAFRQCAEQILEGTPSPAVLRNAAHHFSLAAALGIVDPDIALTYCRAAQQKGPPGDIGLTRAVGQALAASGRHAEAAAAFRAALDACPEDASGLRAAIEQQLVRIDAP